MQLRRVGNWGFGLVGSGAGDVDETGGLRATAETTCLDLNSPQRPCQLPPGRHPDVQTRHQAQLPHQGREVGRRDRPLAWALARVAAVTCVARSSGLVTPVGFWDLWMADSPASLGASGHPQAAPAARYGGRERACGAPSRWPRSESGSTTLSRPDRLPRPDRHSRSARPARSSPPGLPKRFFGLVRSLDGQTVRGSR
jgi:hypothetical protein